MSIDPMELQKLVQAQLAAMQPAPADPATPAAGGWAPPAPATTGPPGVQAVGIPVKLPCGNGNIKITLFFGPEHGSSPDALNALISQLQGMGIPLDVWTPKPQGGYGGGGGGWGNGGQRRGGW